MKLSTVFFKTIAAMFFAVTVLLSGCSSSDKEKPSLGSSNNSGSAAGSAIQDDQFNARAQHWMDAYDEVRLDVPRPTNLEELESIESSMSYVLNSQGYTEEPLSDAEIASSCQDARLSSSGYCTETQGLR